MKTVILSDIDDTLIGTIKKCTEGASLEVAGTDKLGQPLSYTTQHQRWLIDLFSQHEFIPVTGRNKAALDRVSIDFNSFKVIDHGAIILDANDELMPSWAEVIERYIPDWQPILEQYNADINALIERDGLNIRCHIISDYGFPCYVSIKSDTEDLSILDSFASSFCALGDNARSHINGHNMALLPPYTCKKTSVEFLQQHYLATIDDDVFFLAAGDSCSDLPYMNSCDFSLIPQRSQITKERL
jgi:hydroxymethylpyrimidine pyrophosphatase-like HAD family hydrolase